MQELLHAPQAGLVICDMYCHVCYRHLRLNPADSMCIRKRFAAPDLPVLLCCCLSGLFSIILLSEGVCVGLALVMPELGTLISGLMQLAAFQPAASVRAAALHALALLPGHVPWETLHPSKAGMGGLLRSALDDPKRPVRQQAAVTKLAWT